MAIYRLNRVLEDGDAAVMERVRAGDTESFEALVERHSDAVFRLVCRTDGPNSTFPTIRI